MGTPVQQTDHQMESSHGKCRILVYVSSGYCPHRVWFGAVWRSRGRRAGRGLIGQFAEPEVRRTAFWFLIFGPLLMLAGQVGIHAVARGDLALLKMVGIYAFATAVIGVAAFPRSPFWAPMVVAPALIAAGYGWITLN